MCYFRLSVPRSGQDVLGDGAGGQKERKGFAEIQATEGSWVPLEAVIAIFGPWFLE